MKTPQHKRTIIFALVAISVTGCGETYIDESASSTSAPDIASTTAAPITPAGSAAELTDLLADELSTLSQAVIDRDDLDGRSARIDAIWGALEPKLDATASANTADVVELAQLSITSRRPADADKAYRLLLTVSAT